jgi:hypothetical protein
MGAKAVGPVSASSLAHPLSLLFNGYRGSFRGGKARKVRDADHSPHLVVGAVLHLPFGTFMAVAGHLFDRSRISDHYFI